MVEQDRARIGPLPGGHVDLQVPTGWLRQIGVPDLEFVDRVTRHRCGLDASLEDVGRTDLERSVTVLVYLAVLPEGGSDKATLVDLGRELAGYWGALAITLAAVFSVASNLSVSVITTPRLTLSMAEHHTLPAWFARIHDRFGTPHHSIIFYGIVVFIFAATGSFVFLAIAASLSRLLTYLACVIALPVVRRKSDADMAARAFRMPGGYTIPLIGALICIWMIAQARLESWLMVAALLVVGLVLFGVERLILKSEDADRSLPG